MANKTLAEIVAQKPYRDYAMWWPMGEMFLSFMATAIVEEWRAVVLDPTDLTVVQRAVAEYIELVYAQSARSTLATDFAAGENLALFCSGEFDALSYAFFKTAFLAMADRDGGSSTSARERRAFTQRVGKRFYHQLHEHLQLDLPLTLTTAEDFTRLQSAMIQIGDFLKSQGYLRDHFAFRFDVTAPHLGQQIVQASSDFIDHLQKNGVAYALYEMGYPAILPSAVYLYQTLGEAQHHSSRTIEELFGRIGYVASETADFDPTGYPSDMVVELWEIRPS
ncbi:MAG: hypothetical protein R3E79_57495 [Caldilineaceae bacterium]